MSTPAAPTLHRPAVAVRDFQPEDYPAIVKLGNLTYPEHPTTVDEVRFEDEHFDRSKYYWRRLVAVDSSTGRVIGETTVSHAPWSFDPHRFQLWVNVHPEWQRRGIGAVLYDEALKAIEPLGPRQFRSWTQETQAGSLAFLARRGFGELHRSWESRLDLLRFDPDPFAKYRDVPPGVAITTFQEELARDPSCVHAIYEMDNEVAPDMPRVDPFTPTSFEMWRDQILEGPGSLPEAFFLAKDGDRYVGQTNLWKSEQLPDVLYTGLTAVRRPYRGKGIAFALKLRAIDYAKSHGIREIRTWNSSLNAPMLGINVKLGFVKQPVWITLGRDLAGA